MTSIDLKKMDRSWYQPGTDPTTVELPPLPYLMIDGKGDPNTSPEYVAAIETLYPMSYAIRSAVADTTGRKYVVMPLEGLWWTPDMRTFSIDDKNSWSWTMMIRQPFETTDDLAAGVIAATTSKKHPPAADRIRFETFSEGLAAQVMHHGPFSTEGPTIQRLHRYIEEQRCERAGKHHEIYLSDPRRVPAEKMRTVLRQPMRKPQ